MWDYSPCFRGDSFTKRILISPIARCPTHAQIVFGASPDRSCPQRQLPTCFLAGSPKSNRKGRSTWKLQGHQDRWNLAQCEPQEIQRDCFQNSSNSSIYLIPWLKSKWSPFSCSSILTLLTDGPVESVRRYLFLGRGWISWPSAGRPTFGRRSSIGISIRCKANAVCWWLPVSQFCRAVASCEATASAIQWAVIEEKSEDEAGNIKLRKLFFIISSSHIICTYVMWHIWSCQAKWHGN